MSMTFDLHKCSVRDCDKEPVVVVAHLLFCAEHALERERSLPLRRKSVVHRLPELEDV